MTTVEQRGVVTALWLFSVKSSWDNKFVCRRDVWVCLSSWGQQNSSEAGGSRLATICSLRLAASPYCGGSAAGWSPDSQEVSAGPSWWWLWRLCPWDVSWGHRETGRCEPSPRHGCEVDDDLFSFLGFRAQFFSVNIFEHQQLLVINLQGLSRVGLTPGGFCFWHVRRWFGSDRNQICPVGVEV